MGIIYAAAAYTLWGLLPVYWKLIQTVPAVEILCHRMVWSLLFLAAIIAGKRRWRWLLPVLTNWRQSFTFLFCASILAVNWFTYIWAVNSGYIVEASLGYFINPLISVLLGLIFLREKLRSGQWGAVGIAALGVVYLTMTYGSIPWIALTLALSFGCYGLLHKISSLGSLEGLSLETATLFLPALGYLLYLETNGRASFGHAPIATTLLLALTGVATALPLLLFVIATKKITMVNLGLLQYIAPTLQFLLGVFVYGEEFSRSRLFGFILIWLALAVYSIEMIIYRIPSASIRPATDCSEVWPRAKCDEGACDRSY